MLNDLWFRFRSLLFRSRAEAELEDELQAHLQYEAEKYVRAGMPAEEARRRARIALGGVEQTRQQVRDSRGTRLLENFLQDLRYGTRSLLRNRSFAIVVVLTLALGIAACTAVFSLVDAVLFPKLPYPDADKLVYLYTPNEHFQGVPPDAIPPPNFFFRGIRENTHSFSSLTQFLQVSLKLSGQGSGVSTGGAAVDDGFFETLGVKPLIGRAIDAKDNQPGQDGAAVISFALWQQRFGGDANILGKPLTLDSAVDPSQRPLTADGKKYRIVGVMPRGFQYPRLDEVDDGMRHIMQTDVWLPWARSAAQLADANPDDGYAMARLKGDVSIQQAQEDTGAVVAHLNKVQPPSPTWMRGGWSAYVKPFHKTLTGDAGPLLHLLMGAVGFVLLIACGNAASLLLARNASRTHELGVRATLGAGRRRLIQQMLTDALLLGVAGGAVGIGLSWVFLKLLLRLDPGNIPRLQQATLNPRVLVFAVALTLLTSVLTGVLPALSSSRGDLVEFLKSGGNRGVVKGNHRLRGVLVTVEVMLVVVLLAGAGLLIRSFLKVESVPAGFSTATLSMKVELPLAYTQNAAHHGFFPRLLTGIRAIPAVQAAGAISNLPLSHNESVVTFWVQGYANEKGQTIDAASPTAGYFAAMGTPMVAGREFSEADGDVALVNQSFARKYFGGVNPVGKWVRNSIPDDPSKSGSGGSTIVGVVADIHHSSLEQAPRPTLYFPLKEPDSAYIAIRAALPPAEIVPAVRAVLDRLDPTLALTDVQTMNDRISQAIALRRFQTVLLSVFSGMALALALVGLYGLLAYTVKQREQEIGIRLAIGASRGNVLSLVVGQGVRLVIAGLLLGIAGALALQHLIRSFLFGVQATDPVTFLLVPLLLLLTALGACALPGWRAANIDPANSLRYE